MPADSQSVELWYSITITHHPKDITRETYTYTFYRGSKVLSVFVLSYQQPNMLWNEPMADALIEVRSLGVVRWVVNGKDVL